jgi:hypothetical protein
MSELDLFFETRTRADGSRASLSDLARQAKRAHFDSLTMASWAKEEGMLPRNFTVACHDGDVPAPVRRQRGVRSW